MKVEVLIQFPIKLTVITECSMFCYSLAIMYYAVAFKFRNIFDYST